MTYAAGQKLEAKVLLKVVTPTLGNISMLEFDRSPEIIECGRRAAAENLPAILAGYERARGRQTAPQTN